MVDVEHDVDRDISAAESDQGSQEKNHENSVNEEAGPGEDTVHTTQAIEVYYCYISLLVQLTCFFSCFFCRALARPHYLVLR